MGRLRKAGQDGPAHLKDVTERLLAIGLAAALAACVGAGQGPGSSTASGGASPAGSAEGQSPAPESAAGGGTTGVEGSLTTSGIYAATWTFAPEGQVQPASVQGGLSLISDKGTRGTIIVKEDGSVAFFSGASEFAAGGDYRGTGARVTLGTGQIKVVCSFTLDNDLTGTDNSLLHISGAMTIRVDDPLFPC